MNVEVSLRWRLLYIVTYVPQKVVKIWVSHGSEDGVYHVLGCNCSLLGVHCFGECVTTIFILHCCASHHLKAAVLTT
jgi:hypothetical protein